MSDSKNRLLVQVAASAARALMASPLEAGGVTYDWEEVFSTEFSVAALEGTDETTWVALVPRSDVSGVHRWDLAHQILESGLHGAPVVAMVEPAGEIRPGDYPQSLPESGTENCTPAGQDSFWPTRPEFAWHLLDGWSELKRARESVDFSRGRRVRIGHIDTGYAPNNITNPRHVRADLGWNFEKNSADVVDRYPYSPLLPPYTFGGHGPSTLSVLAGNRVTGPGWDGDLGGAPEAEVVPIVATGSVIIGDSTNWGKSVEHAVSRGCDVLSISAGGYIPSQYLFDTTDRAVNRGICIFAAAGNRFGCVPYTDGVTFPAAFPQVMSVTGAMADQTPYYQCWPDRYSACKWKTGSESQLAAYTPNITKARRDCPTIVDRNGDGTSHATPQAAAAAALYIQKWQDQLPSGRRRVHAVYGALSASAHKVRPDFFYQGILRAARALNIRPSAEETAFDSSQRLGFPLFESLPGFEKASPAVQKMLLTEALEMTVRNPNRPELAEATARSAAPNQQQALLESLIAGGNGSAALRGFLVRAAEQIRSVVYA